MKNEPVAWMLTLPDGTHDWILDGNGCEGYIPLYTQNQIEEARKLGMQQERALWNLSESTQEIMDTHPVKEQDESFDRTASHMAGEYVSWTSCVACGQRVTGDSIHTCSPQLKQLTDEEIRHIQAQCHLKNVGYDNFIMRFARAILRKAQEK